MKRIHLLMIGVIVLSGCGRLVKVQENERTIRQVFSVQLSKDEIYDRSLEWSAKRLSRVNDDIVVKDREKGMIIARGTGVYSEYFDFLVDREFSYTLMIEAREGRYRITFDNFVVYYDERQLKSSTAIFKFEINKIRKQLDRLSDDLREYLAGKTADRKDEGVEEEW
ncbi:MAG: DUF4468 domain-containing protein [Chrysiogenales bacterium]|nr:MAG: DUF4468 domain-containing protein [Chrysiogenales bacterium]